MFDRLRKIFEAEDQGRRTTKRSGSRRTRKGVEDTKHRRRKTDAVPLKNAPDQPVGQTMDPQSKENVEKIKAILAKYNLNK